MNEQRDATMHMHTVQWAVMRYDNDPFPPSMVCGPYPTQAEAEAFCAAHRVSREAHRERLRSEGMNPDESTLHVVFRRVTEWEKV